MHWYTSLKFLSMLSFARLLNHQSVFISKCRHFTKWQSAYQKFTATVTQYQEVILEPLLDGQTMPTKWQNTNSTPPHISQCLGVWNATLAVVFSHEGLLVISISYMFSKSICNSLIFSISYHNNSIILASSQGRHGYALNGGRNLIFFWPMFTFKSHDVITHMCSW